MTAFPYADSAEAVLDIALRHLTPDEAPDDGHLDDQRWQVADERAAEFAMLKIRQARQTAARRNAASVELIDEYRKAIDDLQQAVDANNAQAQHTVDHFTALLTDWHRRVLADDPRAKSIRLGAGTLKSTAGRDRVEVHPDADLDALLAVSDAIEGGGFARREVKVDRRQLLAHIKATGEVPPDVEFVRATDADRTFRVEVTS